VSFTLLRIFEVGADQAEWIKLISTQSNSICDESSKKTISPEHVLAALKVSYAFSRPWPGSADFTAIRL
jgi:hypothetical protein